MTNNNIQLLYPFLSMYAETTSKMDELAEQARTKYWDACKYPRKKKKQMRKEAMIDYTIFSWKPEFYL